MTPYKKLFEANDTIKLEFVNHQDLIMISVNDDEFTGRVLLDADFDGRTKTDRIEYDGDVPPYYEDIEDFYNMNCAADVHKLRDGESRIYSMNV